MPAKFDFPMHEAQRAAAAREQRPPRRHAHVPARTLSRWSEMSPPADAQTMRPHIFGEERLP